MRTLERTRSAALSALVVAGCLVVGCASTPQPNAALEQARATYNRAAADPQVVNRAALELNQSKQALDQADALWRDDKDRDDVNTLAYVATRRAQIAEQTARLKVEQDQASSSGSAGLEAERKAQDAQQRAGQAEQRASAAEQRADALQQELASLHARAEQGGYVLTLGDILFATGRAELKPGAMPQLDQLATFLQHHPDRTVLIQGFTDNTGSPDTNLRLSERRADAVRAALIEHGIAGTRIQTRGYGDSLPVASNEDAAGRQLNRRVQVVISDPTGHLPSAAG